MRFRLQSSSLQKSGPRLGGGQMKLLVQKFGGTSVATREARELVCKKIQMAQREGWSVVAVISAMGRKGEPYATDTLLELFSEGKTLP